MGLMSDQILGESEKGTMPLYGNAKPIARFLRGSSSHSKSYLRKAGLENKSASDHRRTCVKSALFSALEELDDSSSVESFSTELESSQICTQCRRKKTDGSIPAVLHLSGSPGKGARKEASKRRKKRRPSRSPQMTRKLPNAVPPPPPGSAPQVSRKSHSHSGLSRSEHSVSSRRRSAFLFGSSSGKDMDSSNHSRKRSVRRSVSLSGGKKHAAKSSHGGQSPCAPSLDNLEPTRRKTPDRSVSLSGTKKHSATLGLKNPKADVTQHVPKKSAAGRLSLGAFLGMDPQRDDPSNSEDDEQDSLVSEQTWISWAASSALKPLEKLYDDLNSVEQKHCQEK